MKALLIIPFVSLALQIHAQDRDSLARIKKEEKLVFIAVEQPTQFIGGIDSLKNFVNRNIIYPSKAKKEKIQGKVYVKFIVERDGSLSEPQIMKGLHPALDREALRIVSLLPTWIPGKQSGRVVRSQYVLPIIFKLDNN